MYAKDGKFLIIVGPSCVGKSTLARTLIERHPDEYRHLTTTTTRGMRRNEVATMNSEYTYVTESYFLSRALISKVNRYKRDYGLFLVARNYGHYYGLSEEEYRFACEVDKVSIAILSHQGMLELSSRLEESGIQYLIVFIVPDTALQEAMLTKIRARGLNTVEEKLRIAAVNAEVRLVNEEFRLHYPDRGRDATRVFVMNSLDQEERFLNNTILEVNSYFRVAKGLVPAAEKYDYDGLVI